MVQKRVSSAITFDWVEIAFIFVIHLFTERINQRRGVGNESKRGNPLTTRSAKRLTQ